MTDYLEHIEIVDLITSMYTRMDKRGICCGFTSMWIQAELAGKEAEQQFMNRLEFIHSRYRDVYGKISPDKLKYDIKNLTKYRKEASDENYDSEILDVMSFFDAVSLQQDPLLYPELFLKSVDQRDKQTLYPLTYSKTLEDAGKAFEFNHVGPLAFTIDELTAYLASVKEVLTQTSEDGAIGFLLSSMNHAIGLSYDKVNNLWKVMDINQPICVSDDDKVIANYISKAFFESEHLLISVQAISLGNQSAAIKDLTNLKNSIYQDKTTRVHSRKDNSGKTLLYLASRDGNVESIKLLFKNGADPNQADNDGIMPLYVACENGHSEVVALLLEKGANPNQFYGNGITPLHVACKNGHSKVATLLLKKGANPNQVFDNRFTPLYLACEIGHSELVVLLLKMGAIPDKLTLDTYFKTYSDIFIKFILHSAYTQGSVENVKLLFNNGMVHKDYIGSKGHSPLYLASYYGNTEVVEFLIEHGADPNQTSKNGATPLLVACQNGHIETVRLLLEENETKLNLAKNDGFTPLYWACKNGHAPIVKLLLEKGALSDLVEKALSENDSLNIADIPGIYDILSFAFERKMDFMIAEVRDIIPNDKRVQFERFIDKIKHNKVTNAPKTSQPIKHGFNNLRNVKDTGTPGSSTPEKKNKP